jgi:oligopeptide/dipeptide ABC transporter ATP-binding protein
VADAGGDSGLRTEGILIERAEPLLAIDQLRVSFQTRFGLLRAVDGVSLRVDRGKTLCIVGESGSGKSVTALAILGLLDSSARLTGRILFEGVDLLALSESPLRAYRGRRIGMIFQEPTGSLNPVLSIGEQVREAIRLTRRVSRTTARREALELLRETRITDPTRVARQYPHQLSGGMNQRVMIAIALAGRPSLLVADEPTTALDVTVQAEILALLARLRMERHLSMIFITHDLGIVGELADDVAVMYAGQVVEYGPVGAIACRPSHPYTQGLWRSMPRLDRPERPSPMQGTVPVGTDWPTGCRFRSRCPRAFEACEKDPQGLLRADSETGSACFAAGIEPAGVENDPGPTGRDD